MDTYKGKSGRTLLVKKDDLDDTTFEGLDSSVKTPSGSTFLTFKTSDNAKDAYETLTTNGTKVKYPLYKIFFKIVPNDSEDKGKDFIKNKLEKLANDYTYDDLKKIVISKIIENCEEAEILYFKFYRKQQVITGPGDLSLDRKDDLEKLVTLRVINILPEYDIQLFRFNVNSNLVKKPMHKNIPHRGNYQKKPFHKNFQKK